MNDPDDREYSEILQTERRKLERFVAPAMPCRRQPSISKANAKPKIGNEKEFVKWSLMNTRDKGQNLCSLKTMRITLQVMGFTSLTHNKLVHKFIPMRRAMKISGAFFLSDCAPQFAPVDWSDLSQVQKDKQHCKTW